MDTSDPDIYFDAQGVCNHCRRFDVLAKTILGAGENGGLESLARRIRAAGRRREYDCVIGLSGGADSSYVALQAREIGLRALAVHLDNGWDSELAVENVHHIVSRLGMDLHTHVIDWIEFRDLQLSLLRASVVDIEVLTDHAITAVLHRVALDTGTRYILSGNNFATEAVMPAAWIHRKSDLQNIRGIHRHFGSVPIKTFPTASTLRLQWWHVARRIRSVNFLNYLEYDKARAKAALERELGWRDYGGKHYESLFTHFYQAYILPTKFGIDKRRAHLSTMICSAQTTRDEALAELAKPLYDERQLAADRAYVLKKWGLGEAEFARLMAAAPRSHLDYPSDERFVRPLIRLRDRRTRHATAHAPQPITGARMD